LAQKDGQVTQAWTVTLICVAFVITSPAHDAHHQDEFNEQQFGAVHFPTSCAPTVQKTFERGVALLHSFAFETAEATFRQVAQQDPHCAMAHWGIAATFSRWAGPDGKQRKQGWQEIKIAKSLHAKTARERAYIAAEEAIYRPEKKPAHGNEYLKRMAKLHHDYPDDLEAAAFYGLALEESDRDDDPTHAGRKQAAAILEKLFAIEPNHPGVAHYLIHTYDVPGMAQFGSPPRAVTRRSLLPLLTPFTCRRTSLRASACGKRTSIQTSPPSPPAAMPPSRTWATKAISTMRWNSSCMPTSKQDVRMMPEL
jgi:tetratricopeptide (TPR) repeat protein